MEPTENKRNSLEDISQEDIDKVERLKSGKKTPHIEPEWLMLSEAGVYFGYGVIRAALSNEISKSELMQLILGARKIQNISIIDSANAVRAAYVSTKSKNSNKVYKDMLKDYIAGAENG